MKVTKSFLVALSTIFLIGCRQSSSASIEDEVAPTATSSSSFIESEEDDSYATMRPDISAVADISVEQDWMAKQMYGDIRIRPYGSNADKVEWTVEQKVLFDQNDVTIVSIGYYYNDSDDKGLELLVINNSDTKYWITSEYLIINGYQMPFDREFQQSVSAGNTVAIHMPLAYESMTTYAFTDVGEIGGKLRLETDDYEVVAVGDTFDLKTSLYGVVGTVKDAERTLLYEDDDIKLVSIKGTNCFAGWLELTNKHVYDETTQQIFAIYDGYVDGVDVENDVMRYTLAQTDCTALIYYRFRGYTKADTVQIHLETVSEGVGELWGGDWYIDVPIY